MDKLADLLRQGADKLVNLPTEAQRFVTNPQAFIQLLTGKNALPRETGFAAGATGLPAQQGTVLDPNYQAYLQGYEQGEPFGYAAMATPAVVPVAKALAPKAGQMAENYMVNQGFMPSIVAYHGTPHTIKGKFDISKVGTGEGAQAYGHGMYFAENPNVAIQYKNILSKPEFTKTGEGIELRGQLPRMLDESYDELVAKNGIQQTNYGDVTDIVGQRLDRQMKDALKANDMDWYNKTADMKLDLRRFIENPPESTGNLYKVDIPDADIPMMMDLDKPLSQQPKVMGALRAEAEQRVKDRTLVNIENDIRSSLPPIDIGNDYMAMFSDANVKAGQEIKKQALEKLNKMDLSSLVNKELESMKPLAMNWNMTGKEYYEFLSKNQGSPAKASEMLQRQGITGNRYLDEVSRNRGQGTSNFVVFEPSNVKILEQNSKPLTRKEILEQELKKVVE